MTKLAFIVDRYREVEKSVGDPEVVSNPTRYRDLMREYKKLTPLVEIHQTLTAWESDWNQCQEWILNGDSDFVALAKEEMPQIQDKLEKGYAASRLMLLPRDEADDRPVMMELRAGTGGDEAALFAGDLYRMYSRFAESKGWKVQLVNANEGTAGGYKEIIARVEGEGVYGWLKFESGVHRVQRVPETESQGRVHTSAATVAIMPEILTERAAQEGNTSIRRSLRFVLHTIRPGSWSNAKTVGHSTKIMSMRWKSYALGYSNASVKSSTLNKPSLGRRWSVQATARQKLERTISHRVV